MNRPPLEILAPVGSPEMLEAAVRCGADAVYMGASAFHARRNSYCFSDDELRRAVAYCHARGVAVHLTLNTLIREEEMTAAVALAQTACAAGVDALIVQDMGLAARIHSAAPELTLHASTQLSCHTPEGVRRLRDAGFSRVVLAREMSAEEIRACELEVFVHGALCMSVSGQCYFSAMLGGRSGNRGLCAQTCRLPFRPDGSDDRGRAALSLKDMSLLHEMSALSELGVCSLKIEGRMKRPEYVAAAVTVYHAAARGEQPDPQTVEDLRAVFSRSGFTDGYFTGDRRDMFGVRRKEDVTAAAPVLKRLQRLYDGEKPRVSVDMALTVAAEQPVTLVVADGEHTAQVTGEPPETALHRALDPERAEAQLRKTGGSPFAAGQVRVNVEPGLTMPLSALNALRRDGLEQLLSLRAAREVPVWDETARPPELSPVARREQPLLIAQFAREAQVPGRGWAGAAAGHAGGAAAVLAAEDAGGSGDPARDVRTRTGGAGGTETGARSGHHRCFVRQCRRGRVGAAGRDASGGRLFAEHRQQRGAGGVCPHGAAGGGAVDGADLFADGVRRARAGADRVAGVWAASVDADPQLPADRRGALRQTELRRVVDRSPRQGVSAAMRRWVRGGAERRPAVLGG